MIKVNAVIYKPLLVNTYVIHDSDSKEAFIVDPGGDYSSVLKILEIEDVNPKFILYTHLHLDHIAGGFELAEQLSIPAYANEADLFLFESIEQTAKFLNYPPIQPPKIDGYLNGEDEFEIGEFLIKVIHTPGHTPGGSCFLIEDHLFSGDTIFKESVGRTDLWGGDEGTLHKSIKEKIYCLPENTMIHAGHGVYSSISHEKKHNPFVKG